MSNESFQSVQSATWSSVAPAWRRWWEKFEAAAQPVNEWLVDAAAIQPGMHVLDVACGIGEPAFTAAKRVGPSGSVLATDFAAEMLAQADGRRAEVALENVRFARMDGQSLALAAETADAAVCRWGLMLIESPLAAATSIARALKPGARLAAAVWAEPADAPFLSIPMGTARELLELEVPDPDAPGPFRLCRPGHLEEILTEAGLTVCDRAELTAVFEFDDADQYVENITDMSTAMRKTLAAHSEADRERVWQAVRERANQHTTAEGRIRFENRIWGVAARRD